MDVEGGDVGDVEVDEETEEETTKKKKKTVDEEEDVPVKKDEEEKNDNNTTDYTAGWTTKEKERFMSECTGTAAPRVGEERAKQYCDCMMSKAEKDFKRRWLY